jgi:tetratricopeptide (TPR) repeat protein
VAWSYDLLEAAAQHLFQAISVFVGGFDYRAMAAVAGTGGRRGGVEHGHLLAALQELVDHRLVQQSEDSEGTRYGQLETIRDYGVELLAASGEQAHVQRRHAEYFLSLVQSAPQQAPGEVHHRWLERLAREQDNLRTALRWLIAHEPAAALQLANGLADFWHRRGYHREGRQWLAQTLALNPTPTTTRAAALLALGRLAHEQGESAAAQRHLDESLQIAQTLGDSLGVARALQQYGWVAYDLHDVTRALAYFAESLALFRRHGERLETAHVLYAQAHVLSQQGVGAEEIEPLLAESLAIYRELDHAPGVAHVLHNQGIRANLSGEYGLAVTLLREALAIHRQVSARRDVGWTLHALGEAEWLQRNLPAARRYLAEGFELFDEIGDKWGQALALHHLAQVDQAEGQLALAQERYQTSLTLFQELKNRHMIARCLAGLGGVALAQGEPERAAYLLAGAQTILDDLPPFLAPGDRQAYAALIEQTKAQLGEAAFAAAWQGGATAPVDQLIHWALARTRRT